MVLPAFALALSGIGQAARLTRANMIETYDRPFIEMARSYGFPERRIANRYAFKPSLIPSLTIIGLDFAAMLGNAFLVEAIFAWPGLSRYGVAVILRKDLNAIVGTVLVISAAFLIANIIVDLLVALLNPRIRHSERRHEADAVDPPGKPAVAARCCAGDHGGRARPCFADVIAPFPEHRGAVVDFANFNKAPNCPISWAPIWSGRDMLSRILYAYRLSLDPRRRRAGDRGADRRDARFDRRLCRRLDRICADAHHRCFPVDPAAGAGHGDHGGAGADAFERHACGHRHVVALVHAAGLQHHPRGTEEGYVLAAEVIGASTVAHHLSRDPAELRPGDRDQDDPRCRLRHPDRLLALLPRPRRPAADAGSRLDGRRWCQISSRQLVADRVSRPRHSGGGLRLQPDR